jgi:hypothetical protein
MHPGIGGFLLEDKMKKVVENTGDTEVDIDNIVESKIYATEYNGGFYKAHKIGDDWCFVSLNSSSGGASGTYLSLEGLIRSDMRDGVYEFDSQEELCRWVLNI